MIDEIFFVKTKRFFERHRYGCEYGPLQKAQDLSGLGEILVFPGLATLWSGSGLVTGSAFMPVADGMQTSSVGIKNPLKESGINLTSILSTKIRQA